MSVASILGFSGSFIAFILWLPQARAIWKVRKDPHALKGVSPGTQYLVIANALIWFAYAYVLQEFWVGAAGFINLPLALFSLVLIYRARRVSPPVSAYCVACGFNSIEKHFFFVTAPPGWGTTYVCPGLPDAALPRGVGVFEQDIPELRKLLRAS